jgi:hypothetical protein
MLNLQGKTKEDLTKKAFVISIAEFCLAFLVGCVDVLSSRHQRGKGVRHE